MSKTFKSAIDKTIHLEVVTNESRPRLMFYAQGDLLGSVTPSASDAPAIALAILSAAGVEPLSEHYGANDDPVAMMRHAAHFLARHATLSEAAAKEAADLQELEAAAWDLFKATSPDAPGTEFGNNHSSRKVWLNVARKARELFGGTK